MIILPEDKQIISLLTDSDAKDVFIALISDDEVPELSEKAMIVYTVIAERNRRISEKKSRAGRTGGAPQGNQNAKKQTEQAKQAEQTKQPSVSVTDTVSDTEKINNPPISPRGEEAVEVDQDLIAVVREWDKASARCMTMAQKEEIIYLLEEYGKERMLYAIKEAVDSNAVNLRYLKAVLRGDGKKKPKGTLPTEYAPGFTLDGG